MQTQVGMVAHACDPRYLGGGLRQEHHKFQDSLVNLRRTYLKI